jgi:hypothetical protein
MKFTSQLCAGTADGSKGLQQKALINIAGTIGAPRNGRISGWSSALFIDPAIQHVRE